MARPREFDPDDALEQALQVFWQHGYEGASLPDLLDGMGLTRGSLYKAFKDKKSLYLLVLARYEEAVVERAVTLLKDPRILDGQIRILEMFKGLVATVAQGDHRGCLLCTAAAGPAAQDEDIAQLVQGGLSKIRDGFAQALKDTPALASLSSPRRLRLANTLLTQYVGLRMLARSRLPLGVLDHAVQGVEEILEQAAK